MVIKVSKIDELLKNEKVEWKKLGEVDSIKIVVPKRKLKKTEYMNIGKYPIIDQGKDFIVGYTNDLNAIFEKNRYVVFGDHTETVKFVDFYFAQGADGIKVLKTDEKYIDSKYLFYVISNFYKKSGKYKRHFSMLKETLIPIPKLQAQEKIVETLDKFTNYVNELQAELQAESQARNKQYEYYRDLLLSEEYLNKLSMKFELTNFQVKCQNLEDITYITSGGDIPKESYSNVRTEKFNIPIISNGVGENAIYGFTDKAKINEDAVTISARGTIGYAQYRNYPFYPIVRLLSLVVKDKSNVSTKYLYYLMQDKKYNLPPTGIPQLTIPMLKKIKVILPSIYIQNKIVEVLDRFQELIENSRGLLPEEIEKRQKQYEYYRKKLLTFEDKSDSKPQAASRKPQNNS